MTIGLAVADVVGSARAGAAFVSAFWVGVLGNAFHLGAIDVPSPVTRLDLVLKEEWLAARVPDQYLYSRKYLNSPSVCATVILG